jgi:adenylate cyclase
MAISGLSASSIRSLEKAVEFSRQALALGDITGYPHLVLTHIQLSKREYGETEAEASEAVLGRPSCPAAYSLKAAVLNYLERPDEAIEFAQYAVRLTPVQLPIFLAMLAGAYHGAGRHEEAVAAAKTALELDDKRVEPHLILAAANAALGHIEEARRAAEKLLKLKPAFRLAEYALSQPYKEQKHLDRLLDQLRTAGLT